MAMSEINGMDIRTMVMPVEPEGGSFKPAPTTVAGAHKISISGTPGPEDMSFTGRPSDDLESRGSLRKRKLGWLNQDHNDLT